MTSNTIELGAPRASFAWDEQRARRMFWVHFPLFVLHVPLALAIIGLPGAFLFGYFALRFFRRWRNRAAVFEIYEHGFIDRRRALAVRHRFDRLADHMIIDRALRLPFPFSFVRMHGTALTAKLRGKHFYVNEHLADIRQCVALLQEGIVRQRLVIARDALARNETLRFGPFRMDNLGLHLDNRMLAWNTFGGLQIVMWRIGKRREPALRIFDIAGAQWDIATRNGLADPAVFMVLCAERRGFDAAALLESFCGWNGGSSLRSEETSGSIPPLP